MDIKEINKKLKELRKQRPIDFHAINELEYQKLKIKQKEKKGKKKTKTQLENELFKKKVAKADEIFSKYIRLRDTKGKKVRCITFINHRDGEKIWIQFHWSHCCHWISRWYWSCRWEEWNCFAGCGYCNTYDQENHHNQLTAIQVKTHGIDWVEKQLREKNKVKPTLDKLDKIIEEFSKKYKDLCEKYKFKW